jgi:hypothetical protein
MARKSQAKSNNDFAKILCQIKGLKHGDEARIEMIENYDTEDQATTVEYGVEGLLVGIMDKTYEHNDEEIRQFMLILEDADTEEVFFLKCGMNGVGRDIINALAGTNELGTLDISVFNDKKSGYAKVRVLNNREKTDWGWHPRDDAEWADKIAISTKKKKVKGKMVDVTERDYTELNDWLIDTVLMGEGGVASRLPEPSPPKGKVSEQTQADKDNPLIDDDDDGFDGSF